MTLDEIKTKASRIDCISFMKMKALEYDISSLDKKQIQQEKYEADRKDRAKNLKKFTPRTENEN